MSRVPRLAALGDAGASPRPERAFKALALAEKAALDVKALADGDLKALQEKTRCRRRRPHPNNMMTVNMLSSRRSLF